MKYGIKIIILYLPVFLIISSIAAYACYFYLNSFGNIQYNYVEMNSNMKIKKNGFPKFNFQDRIDNSIQSNNYNKIIKDFNTNHKKSNNKNIEKSLDDNIESMIYAKGLTYNDVFGFIAPVIGIKNENNLDEEDIKNYTKKIISRAVEHYSDSGVRKWTKVDDSAINSGKEIGTIIFSPEAAISLSDNHRTGIDNGSDIGDNEIIPFLPNQNRIYANIDTSNIKSNKILAKWVFKDTKEILEYKVFPINTNSQSNFIWVEKEKYWPPGDYEVTMYSPDELETIYSGEYKVETNDHVNQELSEKYPEDLN